MTKKSFIAPLVCIFLGAAMGLALIFWQEKSAYPSSIVRKTSQEIATTKSPDNPGMRRTTAKSTAPAGSLPQTLNLKLPFITQAPFRAWDVHPFPYTCEEASVLMLHYYLAGKKEVDESTIREELLEMVAFQDDTYGFSNDSNAEETARLIEDYYDYEATVMDFSVEEAKKELAKGNPIIVPALGRRLENPYFTPPGPFYHMLVIKGYDEEGFVTHDPGTYSKGAEYHYTYEVMEEAVHDFTKEYDESGKQLMIIVEK